VAEEQASTFWLIALVDGSNNDIHSSILPWEADRSSCEERETPFWTEPDESSSQYPNAFLSLISFAVIIFVLVLVESLVLVLGMWYSPPVGTSSGLFQQVVSIATDGWQF
jgi:hypothetical protein